MKGAGAEIDYVIGILILMIVSSLIFLSISKIKDTVGERGLIISGLEEKIFSELNEVPIKIISSKFLEKEPVIINLSFLNSNKDLIFRNENGTVPFQILNNSALVIADVPSIIKLFYFMPGDFNFTFNTSLNSSYDEIYNGLFNIKLNSSAIERFEFNGKEMPTILFNGNESFSIKKQKVLIEIKYDNFSIRTYDNSGKIDVFPKKELTWKFYLPDSFDFFYDSEAKSLNGSGIILDKNLNFLDFYASNKNYGFSITALGDGEIHAKIILNESKLLEITFSSDLEIYTHKGNYTKALNRTSSGEEEILVLNNIKKMVLSTNKLQNKNLDEIFDGFKYRVEFGNFSKGMTPPKKYFREELYIPSFNANEGIYYRKIKIYWWR